jgi:hypothetical protein
MSQLNQKDNPEEFFEKYGFRAFMTMKHPDFKDAVMTFEGLEANYVQRLEREVVDCRKYIQQLQEKLDWLRDREFYAYKEGKKNP